MQCALYLFWRAPKGFNLFLNSNTAKTLFGSWFLHISEIIPEISSKIISEISSEISSKILSTIILLFFDCQLRGAPQALCAFAFLAGAWRTQRFCC